MKILSITTIDPSMGPPSPEMMEKMGRLIVEMTEKGVLIATGGRSPDMMQLQIARANGKTGVTDGPFAESKEVVGGFALLNVRDRDDAIAWTNRFIELAGNVTCQLHEVNVVGEFGNAICSAG